MASGRRIHDLAFANVHRNPRRRPSRRSGRIAGWQLTGRRIVGTNMVARCLGGNSVISFTHERVGIYNANAYAPQTSRMPLIPFFRQSPTGLWQHDHPLDAMV